MTEQIRNCLKCNRPFNSTHKGNRLCLECNKKNQTIAYQTREWKLPNTKPKPPRE